MSFESYELQSELTRVGLHATEREPDRSIAWVNSICLVFLTVGILGSKPASMKIKPLPLLEEASTTIVEPLPPPPQTTAEEQKHEDTEPQKPDPPQVVVVTLDAPSINFAVPTIGNLAVPTALAKAPPLNPLRSLAPLKSLPATLASTGVGGERPQPPYPKIALDQGQQGTVILSLSVDEAGIITAIEVKESSGFPILDRGALEFVKRHWTVQPSAGVRLFEATINYRLQTN